MTIADFLVGLVSAIKKGSEFFGQVCVQSAKAFFCPSGQSQSAQLARGFTGNVSLSKRSQATCLGTLPLFLSELFFSLTSQQSA